MSHLNEKVIKDLQNLCRLKLSQSEEKVLQQRLATIIQHMASLEALDSKDTPPCLRVQQENPKDFLREDQTKDLLSKEAFLENAPASIGGMIQVPVVIHQEENL